MKLETVMIDTGNGPVVINASDFDKDNHKLHKPSKNAKAAKPKPTKKSELPLTAFDANGGPVSTEEIDGKHFAFQDEKRVSEGFDDAVQASMAVVS